MKKLLLFISLAIFLGACQKSDSPAISEEKENGGIVEAGDQHEQELIDLFKQTKVIASQVEEVNLFEALYSNTIISQSSLPYELEKIYNHNLENYDNKVHQLWSGYYKNVNAYNAAASLASKSTKPQIKQFENYLYSYLGYIYSSMMELWGDVIYKTPDNFTNVNDVFPRVRVDEIRKDLIKHLEKAAQSIKFGPKEYKFDKAFPLAVLIRLSFQAKDYEKVKQYAEQIINEGNYQLAKSFELHSTSAETILGYQKDEYLDEKYGRSPYFNLISKGNYVHIIRYTEIILSAAEAHLKLGDKEKAILYLNKVRTRNNKTNLVTSESDLILNAILLEVKEDLGKEGLWFSALKRNGLAIEKLNISQYKLLLPIPNVEINGDLVPQNPGY